MSVTNSHLGADFSGTAEYLPDNPVTTADALELRWTSATEGGVDQLTAQRTFTSVRVEHSGGGLQLRVTDFGTEKSYTFKRTPR